MVEYALPVGFIASPRRRCKVGAGLVQQKRLPKSSTGHLDRNSSDKGCHIRDNTSAQIVHAKRRESEDLFFSVTNLPNEHDNGMNEVSPKRQVGQDGPTGE